jgi:homoserine O-acetyltransferase
MPPTTFPTSQIAIDSPVALRHGTLPGIRIAYETWGDPGGRPVLVIHALSGSSHCFAAPGNSAPGWWEGLLGEGSPFSASPHYMICSNLIGGCYGTTGPRDIDPRTGSCYGPDFPQVTIADMIDVQRRLVRALGIDRPLTLIGGSMGGMIAYQWAAAYPEEIENAIAIAAPVRSYPQAIALRSVQREAIVGDPDWDEGRYDLHCGPTRGLALARKIGMITYRSDAEFTARFGRTARDSRPHFREGYFEVQSYLAHQGRKFVERFDANTYLYFSRAMDLYDLGTEFGSIEEAARRTRGRVLSLGVDSDILCPIYQVEEMHRALSAAGRDSSFGVIRSLHGHDAFLIELDQILEHARRFLGAR